MTSTASRRTDRSAPDIVRTVGPDQLRGDVEVALEPGRWTLSAIDGAGRSARQSFDLFHMHEGRVLEIAWD